ncbi:MAG TPA: HAMP domain-containing sensor histidine kinase [Polyangia bacterium]|nr:HAMP domain-containing sensor histidine kinase [Polyangia bacterium]
MTAERALDGDSTLALAAAAHEIKNALGPLAMTLQLAERQLQAGQPVAAGDLAFARAQVRRLSALVEDLLDQTRADLGELAFRPCACDLREVVAEAVETFRRGKPAPIALELPPARITVSADVGRLQQVLANLLENAVRYSPPGSSVTVRLAPSVAATSARLEVIDRGPGLPPEEQARVFDRFVRGAASEGTGGLGLGLYLCRAIVEQHGGTIGVDSAPGAGATFWVELRTT